MEELYNQEVEWCNRVTKWQEIVNGCTDFGFLESEFTNSVFAEHQFEWAHYGYSRKEHRYIQSRFNLDYNNACLIKYTIRQYDLSDGPSEDIHEFIGAGLAERGYQYLGTTSNDEIGTYLTYWYLKEFSEPEENPEYDIDEDEPYDRWDDPYDDEYDEIY